jgi:hypothetical protein
MEGFQGAAETHKHLNLARLVSDKGLTGGWGCGGIGGGHGVDCVTVPVIDRQGGLGGGGGGDYCGNCQVLKREREFERERAELEWERGERERERREEVCYYDGYVMYCFLIIRV